MDALVTNWIYHTFGNSEVFATIAKIITYLGDKWTIFAVSLILLLFKKTRRLGVYVVVACGLTFVLNDYVIKEIIKRDRPFVSSSKLEVMCELAKMKLPGGYSMTSGHSAVTMALATTVFMFNHKVGTPLFVASGLVGVSRVALCVHYVSDVLMGFAFGIIVAVFVFYALNAIFKICSKKRRIVMKKIIFASNNAHKLKEVRKIMKGFEVLSLKDIGFFEDVDETGKTLADNAKIKAYAIKMYCEEKNINYPIFSDDSGLFVNALNGAPGVKSARYAKSHDDEANRQKLLKALSKKDDRSAYFECVICLLDENGEHLFSGITSGIILAEYKGDTSFGYDCIFESDDLKKAFGEASQDEKDLVSHRGRALEKVNEYFKSKK